MPEGRPGRTPSGSRRPAVVRTTDSSLWGKTIRTAAGWVTFEPPREDGDGGAGVREPRRPRPAAPAAAAVADPEEAFA